MSADERNDGEGVKRILQGWRFFGHPIRPGEAEIASVENRIAAIEKPRVLALGATPELVDLAIRRGARRVTVIDWNGDAAAAMRRIAERDWSGVETIITDWREPREELAESFDVAVGDGTFTFMDFPDDWRLLFRILRGYLVPGGLAVTRELFRPPEPFDFPRRMTEAVVRFDASGRSLPPEDRFPLFRNMLAALRMGSVLAATEMDGRVNREERKRWHGRLAAELAKRYTETDLAEAVDAIFGELSRARPMEAVATVSPDEAKGLIEEEGFRLESCDPIGNLPAPGALRIMSARREED